MTYTVTVTSKRQLTLPTSLFSEYGLRKGQKLLIKGLEGGLMLMPIQNVIDRGYGMLAGKTKKRVKNLDEAIRKARNDYYKREWKKEK